MSKQIQDAISNALGMVKGAFALLKQAEDMLNAAQAEASKSEEQKSQPQRREQPARRPDMRPTPVMTKAASKPEPKKPERLRLDSTETYFSEMISRFIERNKREEKDETDAMLDAGAHAYEIMIRDEVRYAPDAIANFKADLLMNAREAFRLRLSDERQADSEAQGWMERGEAYLRKKLAAKATSNNRSEPPPAPKSEPKAPTQAETEVEDEAKAKPADDESTVEPKAEAKPETSDKRATGYTAGFDSLHGHRASKRDREEEALLERIQA